MPTQLSYPGVYVEEVPSGVRTITGVATSITAFLGRVSFGPINNPVIINSFGDFERQFGGLVVDSPLSYSVRDFYLNGGSQAIIVRIYKEPVLPADAKTKVSVDGLTIEAKSPGAWGKKLRATIDVEVSDEIRTRLGLAATDTLFNLTISSGSVSEKFLNVTVTDNARRLDRVLKAESSLMQWPEETLLSSAIATMPKTKIAVDALAELLVAPDDKAKKIAYSEAKKELDDAVTKAEKEISVALIELKAALEVEPSVQSDIDAAKTKKITSEKKLTTARDKLKGSDGDVLDLSAYEGSKTDKTGLYALDKTDLFNLLCIPPDSRDNDKFPNAAVYQTAMSYCKERRAMLIVDAPANWSAKKETAAAKAKAKLSNLGLSGEASRNAALYFPRVLESDPLRDGQIDTFAPCGIVAGIMTRTDTSRGVWKAPAGLDSSMNGIQGVNVNLNDAENGMLNPLGINCLRAFPINGRVIWGARTLRGTDQLADEYKYIPIRRLALFIEESLFRGTKWVVFEPNDEPLWAQIRLNIGAFMHNLFRQGAFQGTTKQQAYFVKCDKETTTQNDIDRGIVNIVVGFSPLKPAEFVVIKLQQIAGELEV